MNEPLYCVYRRNYSVGLIKLGFYGFLLDVLLLLLASLEASAMKAKAKRFKVSRDLVLRCKYNSLIEIKRVRETLDVCFSVSSLQNIQMANKATCRFLVFKPVY